MTVTGIAKLHSVHNTDGFDCGNPELNRFLRRFALTNQKDEAARAFYEHFNFRPSPADPDHLFLLMKDLARLLGP
ncbi:hypothetical protein [uncultured Thiodictyon sp.]|jgi:hypothetical protein|uniref:hypothetical protein n=1 Tax=uncultured Thiodictyon sp. TaxID=1846217 RepID=UPI0025F54035|nr:hypothetical protein [uncultured Thiodictyon sp.]